MAACDSISFVMSSLPADPPSFLSSSISSFVSLCRALESMISELDLATTALLSVSTRLYSTSSSADMTWSVSSSISLALAGDIDLCSSAKTSAYASEAGTIRRRQKSSSARLTWISYVRWYGRWMIKLLGKDPYFPRDTILAQVFGSVLMIDAVSKESMCSSGLRIWYQLYDPCIPRRHLQRNPAIRLDELVDHLCVLVLTACVGPVETIDLENSFFFSSNLSQPQSNYWGSFSHCGVGAGVGRC